MRSISTIFICVALITLGCSQAKAVNVVCVNADDATDFQNQLNAAQVSGAATTLEVPRGTYHLSGTPLELSNSAGPQGQLDISGGYNSDCSGHINNPALTIIDAGGLSQAMFLASAGGISVRYLTIQNGSSPAGTGDQESGGLLVHSVGGGIIVDYNIFRNNLGNDFAALEAYVDASATSALHVDGNLFVTNTASSSWAAAVTNFGTGNTYITNNTIANNIGTPAGAGGLYVQGSTVASSTFVNNNIAWGNSNSDLYVFHSPVLVNNDYASIHGTVDASSTGNVNVDPQFVSASDFHLSPTSPVLGVGTLTPAGGLPTIDIEGLPRSYNGFVDMGAYERGDKIFKYGFDN
jgi:hypothetical protein